MPRKSRNQKIVSECPADIPSMNVNPVSHSDIPGIVDSIMIKILDASEAVQPPSAHPQSQSRCDCE